MKINNSRLINFLLVVILIVSTFSASAGLWPIPTSHANAGPDQVVDVNTPVSFDGSGSHGVGDLEYTWYFRDGTVTTIDHPNPVHTYSREGVYDVGLIVEDANGYFDLDTTQILVKNYFPTADAGSDITVFEDKIIDFDGSGSSDVNHDIVSYEWDLDDGSTATGITASKSFENAGSYHVTLTVIDNDGAYDKDTITVTVLNLEPTAKGIANGEVDGELTVYEDDIINFDASQSTDTPSDTPHLKYSWDFGDASKGYGITPSHTYTKQGIYYTTLRVTDDNGAYTENIITINVLNAPPDANAGPDQTVSEGDTVFFDALTSSDTPSDFPLLNYSWGKQGYGTDPTYSWYDDSINSVDLLLTDDDGDSDSDSTTIHILNMPPSASINAAYIVVNFTLRASGEKWHDVRLEIFEGSIVTNHVEVTRIPGNPDDQSKNIEQKINLAENAKARVHYTPMDDPVNGGPNGATPVWIEMTFEDGTTTTLFRSFNVKKPDEWVWNIDLGEHLVGKKVHFDGAVFDPGTDDITVLWDFGDGTTISRYYPYSGLHPVEIQHSVEHTFTTFGDLTMTFSASDDDAGSGSDTLLVYSQSDGISVDNVAPLAFASSNKMEVPEDEVVDLLGMGSDTSSDVNLLNYVWDFGDGNSASGNHTAHSYEKQGVYTILLKVIDDSGDIGMDHVDILVFNSQPMAILNVDLNAINEDGVVNFDASSSLDTPRDIPRLSYAWDFGDGSKGYGISASHVYTNWGVYTATLTVQDDNGAASTDSQQITVNNVVPYNVNINAEHDVTEDHLIFLAGSAFDTVSDEPNLVYDWDFGDGNLDQGRNPTHSYSSPGLYTVQLTVVDDDLSSSSIKAQISVVNVDPEAYTAPALMEVYGPEVTLEFEGRGFDTYSDQSSLTYLWDLGGGIFDHNRNVSLTFSSTGVYDISFEVSDVHMSKSTTQHIRIDFTMDSDGDLITDEEELVLGTDPYLWDTDSDNLLDYWEVYDYPTDPLIDDTDSDKVNDWYEVTHFGLTDPDEDGLVNPIDWDSDGEWIMDGLDTHPLQYNDVDGSPLSYDAIKVRNDIELGVSVVMYGGTAFTRPTISNASPPAPLDGNIGIYIEVQSSSPPPFKSQIRVRYDELTLPANMSESNLVICEWSPADDLWKKAKETGVNTTHDFVWAKVTHFAIFAVVDSMQLDSDGDGLKDGYELTMEYEDKFSDFSFSWAYDSMAPLIIKNSRMQVQIPPSNISSFPGLTYGTVDLFALGFVPGDFARNNIWVLTDGVWKVYVSVNTPKLFGVESAYLAFYLETIRGYNQMAIRTISKTDPFNPDTDGDRWNDGDEVEYYRTNPVKPDTDNDGVMDGYDYDPLIDLEITVHIKEILQHDNADVSPWQNGDFYLKVYIDGWWWEQSPPGDFHDKAHEYPDLKLARNIPDNKRYIDVKIQLWDDDIWFFPIFDADDLMDLSRYGRTLDVTYDVTTGLWSGEDSVNDRNGLGHASGNEDGSYHVADSDCDIWFDIYTNDYDGDRLPYVQEVFNLGTDPTVKNSDSDGDGMPDWWEVRYGFDRTNASDADDDADSDELTNKGEYQIGTDPLFFELNLRVTINWNASDSYIEEFKTGIKRASDFLYDVTDGLLYFRYVTIYDKDVNSGDCDMHVHTSVPRPSSGIAMPRYWNGENTNWGDPDYKAYYRAIIHEVGHKFLGLSDEYMDANGKDYPDPWGWLGPNQGPPSVMNDQNDHSELSTQVTYNTWSPPSGYSTTKHYNLHGKSCWEVFFDNYKDKIWFDLDRDGIRDRSYLMSYASISGPGVLTSGGYTILDVHNH
jgi:PKD repeat protein